MRVKDEAIDLARTLEILAEQSLFDRTELIVVDSGSSDGSLSVARSFGARVIEIPSASFTFGGALNRGCGEASAPVIVALSAHAFPPDQLWLERMLAPFDDENVAAACGYETGPDQRPLEGRIVQDVELARRNVRWGYSNGAGAFRSKLWAERSFRADMPGSEDKEWAWYWLKRDWVVVVDPALAVEHDHSDEGFMATYRRARREWEGFAMYADLPHRGPGALLVDWLGLAPQYTSRTRALVSLTRLAKLAGKDHGLRAGQRSSG